MAEVGTGTGHTTQMDELDAEIAAMEAAVQGESPQPQVDPDAVATGADPLQQQVAGDGTVEAITSVDEFIQHDGQVVPPVSDPEMVAPPGDDTAQQIDEQVLEQPGATQTASGRRSWKTDYQDLENRYTKLRQSSDHYKFETRQQIAGLQDNLVQANDRAELLTSKLMEFQSASEKQNVASAFSQEDIDVLGESTVNSFQNAIHTAVDSATKPMQSELLLMKKAERDRLKAQAATNRSQAYQSFEQRLQMLVPDYPVINTNPAFIKWLNEQSPYSGAPRMTFLHQAEASGDVERAAQFFIEFRNILEAPQQRLEQSIVPTGMGGGGAAPATHIPQPAGKKIFTMQFINQFYDDDIAGKYKGKEALRDQIDAEIDEALKTPGRVV
jgi:hypothetical protein